MTWVGTESSYLAKLCSLRTIGIQPPEYSVFLFCPKVHTTGQGMVSLCRHWLHPPYPQLQHCAFKKPIPWLGILVAMETEPSSRELLLAAPSPGFTNSSRLFPCHSQLLFQGPFPCQFLSTLTPPTQKFRALFLGFRLAERRTGRGLTLRKDLIGCSVKGSTSLQAPASSDPCPPPPCCSLL